MITSLEELNNVVTAVVNRIVDVSTSKTMSSNYYTNYEDVSDLISKEDFLRYFGLIETELASREEVLDLQVTEKNEFDAIFGTNWCPNYKDHEEGFIAKPVSQPLSMTRKAEILDNVLRNVQTKLNQISEDRVNEASELFGISVEELAQLNLPAAIKAVAEAKEITERTLSTNGQRDFTRPIEFELLTNSDLLTRKTYGTFEEALAAYEAVPAGTEKELYCQTYRFRMIDEANLLIRSNGDGKDWVNEYVYSSNAHVVLAAAETVLSRDPVNKKAWDLLDWAESQIGVTGHRLGPDDMRIGNWRVHLVPPNGKYGLGDSLTNESGKYLVEFYDLRHIHPEFSPWGQFTGGRYYAETLLGTDGWGKGDYPNGLSLDGDIPAWTVTGPQMKVALDFIRENAQIEKRPSLEEQIHSAGKRTSQTKHEQPTKREDRDRD